MANAGPGFKRVSFVYGVSETQYLAIGCNTFGQELPESSAPCFLQLFGRRGTSWLLGSLPAV